MKTLSFKINVLFSIFIFLFTFSPAIFSQSSINMETTLTDKQSESQSGSSRNAFSAKTPKIYLLWKSDQVKKGQKIKAVWIADDTNNVAPAHYKIDQYEVTVGGNKQDELSQSGGSWSGTFSLSIPNKGWPAGSYHVELFVGSELVKSIPFHIEGESSSPISSAKPEGWGAISVDISTDDMEPVFGIGSGTTKEEAELHSQKVCKESDGADCTVMVSYQQCGAYAISERNEGIGSGETKKIAEETALNECDDDDCSVLVSNCK